MKRLSSQKSELKTGKNEFEVLVIGSGYGGGIAASRMSRAGYNVCLIERGKEMQPGEYPNSEMAALLEMQVSTASQHIGAKDALFDFNVHEDISVLTGCGLGGTSLINANVNLHTDPRVMDDPRWPEAIRQEYKDPNSMLSKGYKLATEMLKSTKIPKNYPSADTPSTPDIDLIKDQVEKNEEAGKSIKDSTIYKKASEATKAEYKDAGAEIAKMGTLAKSAERLDQKWERTDINVNFDINGKNEHGVEQEPCNLCGDCITGCNNKAKNTTLMNYLPDAKNHGAKIYTQVHVDRLIQTADGWTLECSDTETNGLSDEENKIVIHAKKVMLGAGTLGSTKIMLASQSDDLQFSPKLGARFSGNGDYLAFGHNGDYKVNGVGAGDLPLDPENLAGPCITSVIDIRDTENLEEGFIVEDAAIPGAMNAILPVALAASAGLEMKNYDIGEWANVLARMGTVVTNEVASIKAGEHGSYIGAVQNTQTYLVMSHDGADGELEIKREDGHVRLNIKWPGVGQKEIFSIVDEKLEIASDALKAMYVRNPLTNISLPEVSIQQIAQDAASLLTEGDTGISFGNAIEEEGERPENDHALISVHPLGGCSMGESFNEGVVNDKGQVYDPKGGVYEGLYICDGSVVPRSLGVNPLITISAIAERVCHHIAESEGKSINYSVLHPEKAKPYNPDYKFDTVGFQFTETMRGFFSADYKSVLPLVNPFDAEAGELKQFNTGKENAKKWIIKNMEGDRDPVGERLEREFEDFLKEQHGKNNLKPNRPPAMDYLFISPLVRTESQSVQLEAFLKENTFEELCYAWVADIKIYGSWEKLKKTFQNEAQEDYDHDYSIDNEPKATNCEFTLTIRTEDVQTMIEHPEHAAQITGTVTCDIIQKEPLNVVHGTFNLFEDDPDVIEKKYMKYNMLLENPSDGKRYTFNGYKIVENDPEWVKNFVFSKREYDATSTELEWTDVCGRIIEDEYFILDIPEEEKAPSSDLKITAKNGDDMVEKLDKFLVQIDKPRASLTAGEVYDYQEFFVHLVKDDPEVLNTITPDQATELNAIHDNKTVWKKESWGAKFVRLWTEELKNPEFWKDTSTLYTTIWEGEDQESEPLGKGVLRIRATDFATQLTTMTPLSAPNSAEKEKAMTDFGMFFVNNLIEIYGGGKYYDPEKMKHREHRKLVLPPAEVTEFYTKDSVQLKLTRYYKGSREGYKGAVMLVHPFNSTSRLYNMDTQPKNLTEYLYQHGWDVFLLDTRNSIDLPSVNTQFSLDDIAHYDYPAAIANVQRISGEREIHVVALCVGSISLFMSLLSGMKGIRSIVPMQIASDMLAHYDVQLKSDAELAILLDETAGIHMLDAAVTSESGIVDKLADVLVRQYAAPLNQGCENPVCNRMNLMFGALYNHENLNELTHDCLAEVVGLANMTTYKHLTKMIRHGKVLPADYKERYKMTEEDDGQEGLETIDDCVSENETYMQHYDRLDVPTLFIVGWKNKVFRPMATLKTYIKMKLANPKHAHLYDRKVFRNYGHMDTVVGENAHVDVFPSIVAHLDKYKDHNRDQDVAEQALLDGKQKLNSNIKYIVLSDMHLGAENSLLTNLTSLGKYGEPVPYREGELLEYTSDPMSTSPVLVSLVDCIRDLLEQTDPDHKPQLIINGDLMELALTTENDATMVLENFIELAYGEGKNESEAENMKERLFQNEIIFIPGNHDHNLWETARFKHYEEVLSHIHVKQPIPPARHTTPSFIDNIMAKNREGVQGLIQSIGADLKKKIEYVEAGYLTTAIQRFPHLKDVKVRTMYPNFCVLNDEQSKMVVFSHGHFIESIYTLMTQLRWILYTDMKVKYPDTIEELEAENFAWIDFLWSTLGRSGAVGKDVDLVYAKMSDPDSTDAMIKNIAYKLAEVLGEDISEFDPASLVQGDSIVSDIARSVITSQLDKLADAEGVTLKKKLEDIEEKAEDFLESAINFVLQLTLGNYVTGERETKGSVLSDEARSGLKRYISEYLKNQIVAELKEQALFGLNRPVIAQLFTEGEVTYDGLTEMIIEKTMEYTGKDISDRKPAMIDRLNLIMARDKSELYPDMASPEVIAGLPPVSTVFNMADGKIVVNPAYEMNQSSQHIAGNPRMAKEINGLLTQIIPMEILHEFVEQKIPDDVTFIFGHTHKPFQEYTHFDNYGEQPFKVYNSGGFVVDTTELQPYHGGAVILVNDELETASMTMYKEGDYMVRFEEVMEEKNLVHSKFYNDLHSKIDTTKGPYTTFNDVVERAVHFRWEALSVKAKREVAADPEEDIANAKIVGSKLIGESAEKELAEQAMATS